jgi:hypothetical protein
MHTIFIFIDIKTDLVGKVVIHSVELGHALVVTVAHHHQYDQDQNP